MLESITMNQSVTKVGIELLGQLKMIILANGLLYQGGDELGR